MEQIAWAGKVSRTFLERVRWIVNDLKIGNNETDGMSKLLSCMAWESGRTFSASIINKAGSGATGLIQFMPTTARGLGTTTKELASMTAEDQLNYVWKYFAPYKGKLKTLSDIYMAILWPKAVGKPETYVLFDKAKQPTAYRQNAGLDTNKDGKVTKAEASRKLDAMLKEGMLPANSTVAEEGPQDNVPDALFGIKLGKVIDKIDDVADVVQEVGKVLPLPKVVQDVAETAQTVTETAEAITTVTVQPNDTKTKVANAVSGWQGNFAGVGLVLGSLFLNPDFASAVGGAFINIAKGDGAWGALASIAGAGLIAYKNRPHPPT